MKIVIYKNKMKMLNVVVASLLLAGCSGGGGTSSTVTEPTNTYTPVSSTVDTQDAMILCIGQSNMANSGNGLNYVSEYDVIRINSNYDEVIAESPVIGEILASGGAGDSSSFLPVFGDLLIKAGKYESVTYANVAVGGTQILEWTPSYDTNFNKIKDVVEQGYKFSHIIFHQGESDGSKFADTPTATYKTRLLEMLQGIRDLGVDAPIYIARTSYVNGGTDYDIIKAQNELIAEYSDILEGPYTDVLGPEYRYDNAHFNEKGLRKHAEMWNDLIK